MEVLHRLNRTSPTSSQFARAAGFVTGLAVICAPSAPEQNGLQDMSFASASMLGSFPEKTSVVPLRNAPAAEKPDLAELIKGAKDGKISRGELALADVLLRIASDAGEHGLVTADSSAEDAVVRDGIFACASRCAAAIDRARSEKAEALTPREIINAINSVFFAQGTGFAELPVDSALAQLRSGKTRTLASVWTSRTGVCEDLVCAWLSVADRLRVDGHPLPVKAALAPGHILVCWDEPGAAPIYVEMLERGAVVERSKLLDEFNTRPDYTGPYFKPDSAAVISSELMTCAVGLGSRDQARALQYFAWATELCPGNIEAYQNAAGMHFMQSRQEEPATAHVSFERGSALLDAAWQQERSRSLELVRVNNLLSFATRWPAAERTPFFDRALRALDAADSVHFDTRGAKDRHWIGDNSVALRRGEILEQRFIFSADPRDLEKAVVVYREAERRIRAAEKPFDLCDGRDTAARSASASNEDGIREWQAYAGKQIGLLVERQGRALAAQYAVSKDVTFAHQALPLLTQAQKDLAGSDQNRARLARGYIALKLGDLDTARADFSSALQGFKKEGNPTSRLEDLAADGAIKDAALLRILLTVSQDQQARSLANEILAAK